MLDNYREILRQMAVAVDQFDEHFPKPSITAYGNGYVYRHKHDDRTNILAAYLKVVRLISLLNATLILLEQGFVQEANILIRVIDETCDDVTFLVADSANPSRKQKDFLREFYQEQYSDPDNPLSGIPRDRVPHDKKQNVFREELYTDQNDFALHKKNVKSIMQLFSGYVHGAYVFIMEMYDQKRNTYFKSGKVDNGRLEDTIDSFVNNLFRAALAVESVAHMIPRDDISLEMAKLSFLLAEKMGWDAVGLAGIQRRIDLIKSRE